MTHSTSDDAGVPYHSCIRIGFLGYCKGIAVPFSRFPSDFPEGRAGRCAVTNTPSVFRL